MELPVSLNSDGDTVKNEDGSLLKKFIGSQDFMEVQNSPVYVDKTMMIKKILQSEKHVMLCGPRRFNKSTNLKMLHDFFVYDKSTEPERRSVFEKYSIRHDPKSMSEFGKYPIILVDFSWAYNPIKTFETAVNSCKKIMRRVYSRHKYLLSNKGLKNELGNARYEKLMQWLNGETQTMTNDDIQSSLLLLAQAVHKHYNRKVILLVDEFDRICTDALHYTDATQLNEITLFYCTMIEHVIKTQDSSSFLERSILTGILTITCRGLSRNIKKYRFLEDDSFINYYGISLEEFKNLMTKECCQSIKNKEEHAIERYNGYKYVTKSGKEIAILNMWSTIVFIGSGDVINHWGETGVVEELREVIRHESIRSIVGQLLLKKPVSIKYLKQFHPAQLNKIKKVVTDPYQDVVASDLIFSFLLQQGYVSKVVEDSNSQNDSGSESSEIIIKIPNLESRTTFLENSVLYFEKFCKFDAMAMRTCRDKLFSLTVTEHEEDNFHVTMNEIFRLLNEIVTNRSLFTNETWLDHFLYIVFFEKFEIGCQEKIGFTENRRKANILHLVLTPLKHANCCVLIELKIDGTSDAAYKQIVDNRYYDYKKEDVKRKYLIGLNFNNYVTPDNTKIEIKYSYCYDGLITNEALCF